MIEVRCCCKPENLIGQLPEGAVLPLRELDDGTIAYSSEGHAEEEIRAMPGFQRYVASGRGGTKKTWRKTWRKR